MPGSVVAPAALLLALLAAVGAQQQHTCSTEGGHVICRSDSSRVEFLNESRTWREAHELCRRRDRFLVPSRGVLSDTALETLLYQKAMQLGTFWVGAKYLRNGYYEWLVPLHDGDHFDYEQIGVSPGVDSSTLCGRVATINNELELSWSPCASLQKVVCFSDDITDAETSPPGYQPSLTVQAGGNVFRPAADADEVLIGPPSMLTGLQLRITCDDGDSVVKDYFVIGRTEYRSEWWFSNFTITNQLVPPSDGHPLTVGTFWCQRYVKGATDPVTSGRLHVTPSVDIYVLTMPRDSIVTAFRFLFSQEFEEGSGDYQAGPQFTGSPSSGVGDIVAELRRELARTTEGEISFLALYDFPTSRPGRQEADTASEGESVNVQGRIVSLIVNTSRLLDGDALQRANFSQFGGRAAGDRSLRRVFRCDDEQVGDSVWRHRLPAVASAVTYRYTPSEPACAVNGLSAQVERRCRPSFDRDGAQWGRFCAAGVCQDRLPHCEQLTPVCPPGFTSTTDAYSEGVTCVLLLTGVTFKERELACRRREPSAVLWSPRRRLHDELTLLSSSVVNQTVWLPYQRLWSQGPLWPRVQDLLSGADRREADLNSDLNCSVVTPRGRLASASCTERHAALCVARPVFTGGQQPTSDPWRSSRLCESLGPDARLADGSERCFAVLCSDSELAISWPEAASLCTESNASLSSLTSQRQLDVIARLDRPREPSVKAAVNLTRRDGQVMWRDGTPLAYPALTPDLSAAEQHTHGVLDLSRRQYDFVGEDERVVTCAVCDKSVTLAPPDVFLFYGDAGPGAGIFANVTNVQSFMGDSEDLATFFSCFVSTSQTYRKVSQGTQSGRSQGDFRVSDLIVLEENEDNIFVRVTPRVDFGYLVCGVSSTGSVEATVSNALTLTKRHESTADQEYVVGLRGGQWGGSQCDPTFCGTTCPCLSSSLHTDYHIWHATDLIYFRSVYLLRATRSDPDTVLEHYFVAFNFGSQRLRRQAELNGPEGAGQVPDWPDGAQILRNELGPQVAYIRHARCCPADQTELPVRLRWPMTCSGNATSVEHCVDDAGRRALRRCLGSPLTGVQWGSVEFGGTTCGNMSSVAARLHRLSQTTVMADNSVLTATKLAQLTSEPAALGAQDVVSIAVTLENVQNALEGHDRPPPEDMPAILEQTVKSVSHAMDVDSETVAAATKSLGAGPRVVRALERILTSLSAESVPFMTAANVVVRSGDFVGVSSASQEFTQSSIRWLDAGVGWPAVLDVEAALLLEDMKPSVNVAFLIYRDGRLLQSSRQLVTSQVVSALLLNMSAETQFQSNVLVTFRSRPGSTPTCAFWDVVASQWSTRGCWLEDIRNGSDVCRCNHLTNFARILNYETDVYLCKEAHRSLDVITYVGCALSLIGLLLTMLTFALFKKWQKPRGNQIVMHLSVALTGVYLAFLLGLAVTDNHVACICLSALLHYFLLASFGWMAVEAVFQYLRFVRVVNTYVPRFMHKASLFAWGGALVPVVCMLAARPHGYDGQPDVCWMDFQSFHYALALPVLAVMAVNIVLFGIIVYSLSCGRQKGLRTNQSERQLALRRLRVAIITFILLGLPWVFGFLSIREARPFFAILFCICSMLQGVAIFLLMVAGERGARELWHTLLARQCCASADAASSVPMRSLSEGASQSLMSSTASQDTRV